MATSHELNLDGLVGPTHSYAGLSYGNLASQDNKRAASNPREAALQGLGKMKLLADLGVKQAVLPPQERPDVAALRRLGFTGTDARVLERAGREDPVLLAACCSASAHVGGQRGDGLAQRRHRRRAGAFHAGESAHAVPPLAGAADDRGGAAGDLRATSRLRPPRAAAGRRPVRRRGGGQPHPALPRLRPARAGDLRLRPIRVRRRLRPRPRRFPARQTREAAAAVARLHGLRDEGVLFSGRTPPPSTPGRFTTTWSRWGTSTCCCTTPPPSPRAAAASDPIRAMLTRRVSGRRAVRRSK